MARDFVPASTQSINLNTSINSIAGLTNGLTVSIWFNPDANSTMSQGGDVNGSDNASAFEFFTISGTPTTFWGRMYVSGAKTVTGGTVNVGSWNHTALTYDGANVTLWGNGSQIQQAAATGNISNSATNIFLGKRGALAFPWDGKLAEFAVWAGALGAGEIAALARGYSPASIRPGILSDYWPLVRADLSMLAGVASTFTNSPAVSDHPRVITRNAHSMIGHNTGAAAPAGGGNKLINGGLIHPKLVSGRLAA
jgi:hypothetical protein